MIAYKGTKMTASQFAKEYVFQYGANDYIWGMWKERVEDDVIDMTESEAQAVDAAISKKINRVAMLFGFD